MRILTQRIPLRNSFEILTVEEFQDKPEPNDEEKSISPSFDDTASNKQQTNRG